MENETNLHVGNETDHHMGRTDHHDASSWDSIRFPGVGNEETLRESFRVLNAWAIALRDWEMRIRAMCGILEAKYELSAGQFENVVQSVRAGKHSKADIREALENSGGGSGVIGASDVVGHPPDPPFQEPIT